MRRMSASMVCVPPTRSNVRDSRTRSSLTCVAMSISPISSRNSVPPEAISNRPLRSDSAPVKAPFSCPKSSLSRRVGERAAQLTATNGALARVLNRCIAFATSSLPVPLGPVMRTVASVGAAARIISKTGCMASALPIMLSMPYFLSSCWPRRRFSSSRRLLRSSRSFDFRARSRTASRWSRFTGFVRKS